MSRAKNHSGAQLCGVQHVRAVPLLTAKISLTTADSAVNTKTRR